MEVFNEPVETVVHVWDCSTCQFQGMHACRATRAFKVRNGPLNHVDCRKPPHHGKCRADGGTHTLKMAMLEKVLQNHMMMGFHPEWTVVLHRRPKTSVRHSC